MSAVVTVVIRLPAGDRAVPYLKTFLPRECVARTKCDMVIELARRGITVIGDDGRDLTAFYTRPYQ